MSEPTPGKWKATSLRHGWGVDSYHRVTGDFLMNVIKHGSVSECDARFIEELHNMETQSTTIEQNALQRLKAMCNEATPVSWDTIPYIKTISTALPILIELCEAYEAEMTDYWNGKVMNNDRSKSARAKLEEECR